MPYTIRKSDGTTLGQVADQTINTTLSSLSLVGRGSANYGQTFAENFVRLVEHHANGTAPALPLKGQIWFDTSTGKHRFYDGSAWKDLSAGAAANFTVTGSLTAASIIPPLAGGGDIGSSSNRFSTVFATTFDGTNLSISGSLTAASIIPPLAGGGNIGSSSNRYGTVFAITFDGIATSAKYADLAERYEVMGRVEPGDLVELGGQAEVRRSVTDASGEVFGVVSSTPAYMMNSDAGNDDTHPYIAMIGRVPCKVFGEVRKGQRLVASVYPGVARAARDGDPAEAIFGRAISDKRTDGVALIEIVVGVR
jgi:hypothetical protein